MPDVSDDLPADGPTSLEAVKLALSINDAVDDAGIQTKVGAVNALVRSWPVSLDADGEPAWPASITDGATMLAARLWRRKGSPAGVESIGELGAVYVMRNDPDIAMLLRLGSWEKPMVG